jgi:hypothetical protein
MINSKRAITEELEIEITTKSDKSTIKDRVIILMRCTIPQ